MNHDVYINYKRAYVASKINEIVENFIKNYPSYNNEELVRKIVYKIYHKTKSLNSLLDGTIDTKILIFYREALEEQEEIEDNIRLK